MVAINTLRVASWSGRLLENVIPMWHMILSSNLTIDDTLNLPGIGCSKVVSTLRFGFPWKVLKT